jgi:dihydropteroate synthase
MIKYPEYINAKTDVSVMPKWMSIVNITPDSFHPESRFEDEAALLHHVQQAVEYGATWLDVGAESTRPGAQAVPAHEELQRLERMWASIIQLKHHHPTLHISLDTQKPDVAREVHTWGVPLAAMNDTSGGRAGGQATYDFIREQRVRYIIMHSRGTPETMNTLARYDDVVEDVTRELQASVQQALTHGVPEDCILIDPGIGFAKNQMDSMKLLGALHIVKTRVGGYPLVLGLSRKRCTLHPSSAPASVNKRENGWLPPLPTDAREAGTTALHLATLALCPPGTIKIIRTHDVPQQATAWTLWQTMHTEY